MHQSSVYTSSQWRVSVRATHRQTSLVRDNMSRSTTVGLPLATATWRHVWLRYSFVSYLANMRSRSPVPSRKSTIAVWLYSRATCRIVALDSISRKSRCPSFRPLFCHITRPILSVYSCRRATCWPHCRCVVHIISLALISICVYQSTPFVKLKQSMLGYVTVSFKLLTYAKQFQIITQIK